MESSSEYWNRVEWGKFSCPNIFLFRFLSALKIDLDGSRVLELGFGSGADLFEMVKRGASAYGVDISKSAVDRIKRRLGRAEFPKVMLGDISDADAYIKQKFDLVYSHDVLYYLSESELKESLSRQRDLLNEDGKIVMHVVTGDYRVHRGEEIEDSLAILKESGNPVNFRSRDFYINCIKELGLKIIGEKDVVESFFIDRKVRRHNYYICLEN